MFFSSPDRRILFKTLRGAETGNLKAFLQDYASYMSTYPNSLLPKFLGLYTLERMSRGSDAGTWNSSSTSLLSLDSLLPPKFTVVAMAHVFDTPLPIHAKLDFKGSHLGREALDPQLPLQMQLPQTSSTPTSVHNPNPFAFDFSQITLKELDFHRLFNTGLINRLCLTPHVKSQLIAQLTRDITLLQKRGFMDYRYA